MSGSTATFINEKGRVTRDTSERIKFVFDNSKDTRAGGGYLKGVYFKTNNKFMLRVESSIGYRPSGPIWGICEEISISSSNNVSTPTEPTTTSSSKIDKAKSTCTKLGFTAGTEKHGECVLKLMDN